MRLAGGPFRREDVEQRAAAAEPRARKECVSPYAKRAFPCRTCGRRRPGRTASSTAVPCPSLRCIDTWVEVGTTGPGGGRPNLGASARRPADTRRARPNWQRDSALAGSSARPGGGDADRDPTLACSRGRRLRRPRLPTPSADGYPRWTLVAARHARQPDHRGSDQPAERCRLRIQQRSAGRRQGHELRGGGPFVLRLPSHGEGLVWPVGDEQARREEEHPNVEP